MHHDPDVRWNFRAAVIDACGWGVGMGIISPATFLPLFVQRLTPSPLAVGMIQAVMMLGWLGPGILSSPWVERLPRVKLSVMCIAALERSMLLLMGILCFALGRSQPQALLLGFFACWTVMNTAVGVNTPGYYKLIAKTIPASLRGRLYGIGGAFSGLLGTGAALLAGLFLRWWDFPTGFGACFLAAFVFHTLSVTPLAFIREPVQAEEAAPEHKNPWRTFREVAADRRLLWLCAALALFSLNAAASAFYTSYAIQRFHAGPQAVAGFTAALMAARTVASMLAGWLGDHHGNRAAMLSATVAGILAAGVAAWAPGLGWIYLVFALNEVAVQGWGVCSINYVLELCPPERSGTYTGVFALLSGPLRVGLPLVGGLLVESAGYGVLFVTAVVGGALALAALLARVPEPRNAVLSDAKFPTAGKGRDRLPEN